MADNKSDIRITPALLVKKQQLNKEIFEINCVLEDKFESILYIIADCFNRKISSWYFDEGDDIDSVIYQHAIDNNFIIISSLEIFAKPNFETLPIICMGNRIDLSDGFPADFLFATDESIKATIMKGKEGFFIWQKDKIEKAAKVKLTKKENEEKKLASIMDKLNDEEKELLTKKISGKKRIK